MPERTLATQNMKMEHVDIEIAYQVLGKEDLWVEVIYEHRELANKSAVRQGRERRRGSLTLEGGKLFRNCMGDLENGL